MEKETFTKRDRIRDKKDFKRLKTSGVRLTDGEILMVILPTDIGFPRLGIAVPKRIGSAATRNRIKRLIREVFRLNRDLLPGSIDLLIVMRKTPESLTLAGFRDRIFSLVKRYQKAESNKRSSPERVPPGGRDSKTP